MNSHRTVSTTLAATAALSLAFAGCASSTSSEEFKVTLRMNSQASLRTVPLEVRYEPQAVAFIDAQPGEFAGRAWPNAFEATADTANGLIRIVVRAGAGQPLQGQSDLVTLRFTAGTAGKQTQLSVVKNDLRDDTGNVAAIIRAAPMTVRVGS